LFFIRGTKGLNYMDKKMVRATPKKPSVSKNKNISRQKRIWPLKGLQKESQERKMQAQHR
jgi:hypothetical protein